MSVITIAYNWSTDQNDKLNENLLVISLVLVTTYQQRAP